METEGRLTAKELKDLSDELARLAKKQSDARQTEIYIRMTPEEIKDFDHRKHCISRIYVLLNQHDGNDSNAR